MSRTDPTFNLTALADRLAAERRMLPLVDQIRRARELHSLTADLRMAQESINALEAELLSPSEPDDHRKLITEASLLNNALIMYVRATKTQSDERRGFDLRSKFSAAEILVHRELIDLRDKAIAHFGSGGSYMGEWQAELVILQVKGDAVKAAVVTRRQTIDRLLIKRAKRQIEVALRLMSERFQEKMNDLRDCLDEISALDPSFIDEVTLHPLNFDVFMMSSAAADAARSSFDAGSGVGISVP